MTNPERIGKLLYRYTRRELSGKDEAELLSWRGLSLGNEKLFETETDREHIRKQVGRMFEDRDYVFQKLREEYPAFEKYKSRTSGTRLYWVTRIAAACVIIGVGLYFFDKWQSIGQPGSYQAQLISYKNISQILNDMQRGWSDGWARIKHKNEKGKQVYTIPNEFRVGKDKYNTIVTPRQGQFIVRFSDSTLIWFNSESSVKYPVNFSQDTIQLEILGEAYIEIAPGTKHFFTITLPPTANRQPPTENKVQIKTSAAHFNVVNYPDEPVGITMINDSARVELEQTGVKATVNTTLHAGDQAKVNSQTFKVGKAQRNDDIIAWKNDMTVFYNADIQTIMRDVARWYDVEIVYSGAIPDKRFNLRIPRVANLKELIAELKKQGAHISLFWGTVTVGP